MPIFLEDALCKLSIGNANRATVRRCGAEQRLPPNLHRRQLVFNLAAFASQPKSQLASLSSNS